MVLGQQGNGKIQDHKKRLKQGHITQGKCKAKIRLQNSTIKNKARPEDIS